MKIIATALVLSSSFALIACEPPKRIQATVVGDPTITEFRCSLTYRLPGEKVTHTILEETSPLWDRNDKRPYELCALMKAGMHVPISVYADGSYGVDWSQN